MKSKLLGTKASSTNRKKKQNKLFGHLSTVKSAAKVAVQSEAGAMAVDAALSSVPLVPSSVKEAVVNKALDTAGVDIEVGEGSNTGSAKAVEALNETLQQQQTRLQKLQEEVKVIKNALIKLIKRVNQTE